MSHDRYFLEAVAGRIDRAEPRLRRGPARRARPLQHVPREEGRAAGRPGVLPGIAAQPRARRDGMALAQGQGAHAQGAGAHRRGGAAAGRAGRPRLALAVGRRSASTSPAPSARRSGCSWPRASRSASASASVVARPRPRALARDCASASSARTAAARRTLLRLLAGLEPPDAGTVEPAPNLRIVMFDQHRSRLDPAVSLRRTLAPFGDSVVFQGRRDPRGRLGQALPVPRRAARDARWAGSRAASRRACSSRA